MVDGDAVEKDKLPTSRAVPKHSRFNNTMAEARKLYSPPSKNIVARSSRWPSQKSGRKEIGKEAEEAPD